MLDFEAALANIQNAASGALAFEELNRSIARYGYNRATYSFLTDHASIGEKALHGVSTSYPDDWLKYYGERDYFSIDPVISRMLAKPGAFFWDDAVEAVRRDQRLDAAAIAQRSAMMQEAVEVGLADGIGVSFVNEFGEIAAIGISRADKERKKDYRALAELAMLSTIFHEKFGSYSKPTLFPILTNREKEVLLWSSEGKSDLDISQILGISRAAVRFHWNKIFKKLGVNSKLLATITAIRCKIIIPHTVNSLIRR